MVTSLLDLILWLGKDSFVSNRPQIRLSDAQRVKLCEMMHLAFVEIRWLSMNGKSNQARDLADAFNTLPKEMWKDNVYLDDFRNSYLKLYHELYPPEVCRHDYVAMVNEVIMMRGRDSLAAN